MPDVLLHAGGNIATAGGCPASWYLAPWVITRTCREDAARAVIGCAVPVGGNQKAASVPLRAVRVGEAALRLPTALPCRSPQGSGPAAAEPGTPASAHRTQISTK
ncbi:hypothetical protein [Streptomyces sp. NBC_00005]|uniref:hypothetical protein n=1 Tax=Streptomyces sp. NBC_00005 TaxID=2903609 RepID=UPI00386809DD